MKMSVFLCREVDKNAARKATFSSLVPGAQYTVTVQTVVGSDILSDALTQMFYISKLYFMTYKRNI